MIDVLFIYGIDVYMKIGNDFSSPVECRTELVQPGDLYERDRKYYAKEHTIDYNELFPDTPMVPGLFTFKSG